MNKFTVALPFVKKYVKTYPLSEDMINVLYKKEYSNVENFWHIIYKPVGLGHFYSLLYDDTKPIPIYKNDKVFVVGFFGGSDYTAILTNRQLFVNEQKEYCSFEDGIKKLQNICID
jgi:hypothetical protein